KAILGIMPKPTGNIPKDMFELINLADDAIYKCTGLSPEYMGLADREQANVLELTRRQSTLNVLSEPFEHARYLRIDMGRTILWLIKNTLPNNTLMGVNGVVVEGLPINGGYKALKFNKKLVAAFDYDVIVD
ncbi:phage portal protein, partial [Candidatus Tokpelaia sp.]